jgi:DsbC/DsbD-like thiol-disulfide interchange protein
VGFRLQHAAGWHSYWKNPGLAGVAFGVEWDLPAGWKAAEMQYAPPDKVYMATTRTHGYEHDVLHLVQLTPPADLALGELPLKVKAHWLCCSTTCAIGTCELELTLPVAVTPPSPGPAAKDFTLARSSLPVNDTEWKFHARRIGDKIELTCTPNAPGKPVPVITPEPVFFSDNKLICSDPSQRWTSKDGNLIGLLPVADYAPAEAKRLSGLFLTEGKYRTVDIALAE